MKIMRILFSKLFEVIISSIAGFKKEKVKCHLKMARNDQFNFILTDFGDIFE